MTIKTIITFFDFSQRESVEKKWRSLEQQSNANIFLSWMWIGNWLDLVSEQASSKLFLVEANQNNQVVGLGFFVEKTRKVFGCIPIKQFWLHRTGVAQQDQIWIEYNDFLLAESIAVKVRASIIEALYNYDNSLKEIVIGLSCEKVLNCFHQRFSLSSKLMRSTGYEIDFSSIENSYSQEVLSKNTRSQINRSNKILNQIGDVSFKVVTEINEIKSLYKHIAKIHIERWDNTKEGSGFSNESFLTFHQQLLENANTVQVAVLLLNNNPIGYLVNFIYKQRVYFYLSALTTFSNNKIKVGLTLHEKAIDYYAKQGMKSYDFLGGEARYKQSMSNTKYTLAMTSFSRNSKLLATEKALKNIKCEFKLLLSKYIG